MCREFPQVNPINTNIWAVHNVWLLHSLQLDLLTLGVAQLLGLFHVLEESHEKVVCIVQPANTVLLILRAQAILHVLSILTIIRTELRLYSRLWECFI